MDRPVLTNDLPATVKQWLMQSSAEVIEAMNDLSRGEFMGRPLTTAEEWQTALATIVGYAQNHMPDQSEKPAPSTSAKHSSGTKSLPLLSGLVDVDLAWERDQARRWMSIEAGVVGDTFLSTVSHD